MAFRSYEVFLESIGRCGGSELSYFDTYIIFFKEQFSIATLTIDLLERCVVPYFKVTFRLQGLGPGPTLSR